MENNSQIKSEVTNIERVMKNYLRLKVNSDTINTEGQHLDQDALTAFVEGSLTRRETPPIVNHLVKCSFCRHITAELVRLDLAFADNEEVFAVNEKQPSKVSGVLSGLLTRIFGNSDNAVFAHQEKDEETDETDKLEKDKK